MAVLHTILVPVDGSAPSLAALDHAIALAEDGDASIDILHVEAPPGPLSPVDTGDSEHALSAAVARAQAHLGDRVVRRTVSGDPLRKILEVASDGRYDLVVIGTHGRTGRLHSLLGSVAEGVVRNAPCPVLTVREPGVDYESFAERRHGRPTIADQVQPEPR